jgi:hypothetical protein
MVYARLGSLVKIGLRSPRAVSLPSPISAEPLSRPQSRVGMAGSPTVTPLDTMKRLQCGGGSHVWEAGRKEGGSE